MSPTPRAVPSSIADLAAATPASRERFLDFLRAASILAVVLGHWLVATVVRDGNTLTGENALASMPWLEPVTWVFQVMPVFFFVGGFANAQSLAAATARGGGAAGFLARRTERLLRPTAVFVAIWLVAAALIERTGIDDALLRDIVRVAAQPLWFLAVYLLIVLVAPLQWRVHSRAPWLLVAVLPAVAGVLDAFRLSGTASGPAYANYLVVFVFAQEFGFFYARGAMSRVRPSHAVLASAAAFVTLGLLTTVGPYPVSMVGLPGQLSNMSPPTTCIIVLTVAQVGALLAARGPIERWLRRPRPWRATIAVNVVIMTLFLWHLSALVAAGAALIALGLPLSPVGTTAWWAERVAWIATATAVLVPVVLLFSRVELSTPGPRAGSPKHAARAALGVALCVRALIGFALSGFAHLTEPSGRSFLWMQLSPLADAVLLAIGWALACGIPRRAHMRR